jgi:predicted transposase/invertase (TIGR01784 family)
LLIDFLNSLLPDQKITDLTYNRVDRLGATEEHRKAIFDLYCENDKGEKFIVELQKVKQKYFKDRSVYYSTFPIQEQAVRGSDWDFKLKAVYFVGILDFVFDDENKNKTVVTEAKLMDTRKNEVFYDKLTFMYLQMPNFNKQESELQNHFEKWLFVLRYLSKLQDRPRALQEKVFEKLFAVAEIAKFKPEERMDYEESVKGYRDTKNSIDTAKAEGVEIGVEIGKNEGREEKAIDIAREMIADKEPIERIVKYTKLEKSFIEALIKEIEPGK